MLELLEKQFLCGFPINEMSFCDLKLDYRDQESLLNSTINSQVVLKYPIKIDYQKAFLKRLINKLENNSTEIHEEIFSAYLKLLTTQESNKTEFYKHYKINNNIIISLLENINLISEGTTGLRTWQASLALSEWCLENKTSLKDKNILELGSGIGLLGLVILHECQPGKFHFSDCHPAVLKTLNENVQLNKAKKNSQILNLAWENVNNQLQDLNKIDYILAADVVYDKDLFQSLIGALKIISEKCGVENIVFACTERNQETLKEFLQQIENYFEIVEEQCPRQKKFVWSIGTPVRIFRFRLS